MRERRAASAALGPEQIRELTQVALGERPADMAIVGGDILNVYTGEVLKGCSVAVKAERIASVAPDVSASVGPHTQVIEATGKVLIPGLIDGHTHLMYLYTVEEFLKYAMRGGTTTIITEMMELAFPLGPAATLRYLDALEDQPVKIYATAPPMVSVSPAAAATGMDARLLRRYLRRDRVLGLGESFWLPVVQGAPRLLELIAETQAWGKRLEGHSSGARDARLNAYLACGVSSCHEPITAEEALERLRLGLHVLIREGEIRRDLEAVSRLKDEKSIDLRRLAISTDSVGPEDLLERGYMEVVVQKAIDLGFDPVAAVQMATLNPAEHFGLDGLVGGIAPGRYADIVIIPDLRTIRAEKVISNGRVIAEGGQLLVAPRGHRYPRKALHSIRLPRRLQARDFDLRVDAADRQVGVRVVDYITDLVTRASHLSVPVHGGLIKGDTERDILKIAAIDRTNQPGKMTVALARGFKLRRGALATSASWDTYDIVVVGADEEDMAAAVNRVAELQGGMVVCAGGEVLAELPLSLGGHVSLLPMAEIASRRRRVQQAAEGLGTRFANVFLSLATVTSAAIPHFRLCDEGLVNVRDGQFMELIVR